MFAAAKHLLVNPQNRLLFLIPNRLSPRHNVITPENE
tara:strand:+ start:8214 stop:8324 length:111 start_codon:yes stop_codon:yes gene_type:complete